LPAFANPPATVSFLAGESSLKQYRMRTVDLPGSGKPVTNQVTTTPGNSRRGRRAQTIISVWPAVIRPDAMPSDETFMHGKEKVYGSIP
jgi:hypothetical protein